MGKRYQLLVMLSVVTVLLVVWLSGDKFTVNLREILQETIVCTTPAPVTKIEPKIQNHLESEGDPSPARDVLWQEIWPEKQLLNPRPDKTPRVYYLWCGGRKKFGFVEYLSVLSVFRVFRPMKLEFHYSTDPQTDEYNSWFHELKSSIPGLRLKGFDCKDGDFLDAALQVLTPEGGAVIGQNTYLSRPPPYPLTAPLSVYSSASKENKIQGVVFAGQGFREAVNVTDRTKLKLPISNCVSVDDYNKPHVTSQAQCINVTSQTFYPQDIFAASSPFAELVRWFFYGRRKPLNVRPDPSNPIPRISHFVKLHGGGQYGEELSFGHFMNILSALYLGGLKHVYLHAERAPRGRWWEEVSKENVTAVRLDMIKSIYQTDVKLAQHVSDIIRAMVVYKYGGVYQDFDVTWVSRLNDSQLAYPTVMSKDWPISKLWPAKFNNGVIMGRAGAPWIRHYLATLRDYRDKDWGYNSLRMSYRTFEYYPDTILVDPHLQVLCWRHICHPTWEAGYARELLDRRPTLPIRWRLDQRALHVTSPKPHPSLKSPEAIKNSKDMFGEIGRTILEKSGRKHLIA